MTASSLLKEVKRQRLQTLARAFTECNHLAVQFATAPATDIERTVYLKELDGEIVPGVPAAPAECWMTMKAECAHEAGHVLFTDKKAWENACGRGPLFQHIVNVLEDARIERAVANAYPGTLNWLRFKNEYLYRNHRDTGEGAHAFLWGLCSYAIIGKVPDALDPETKSRVEKSIPIVDKARLARSTWEVLEYAEKIHALVKDAFPVPDLPPVPETGTDSPREAPQGPLDPRPVKRKKRQESDGSPEEPREDKAGGQTDGEDDRENTDGSGESAEKDRSPKEASDGSRDDSGEGSKTGPETSGQESGADGAEPDQRNSGSNEDSGEEADGEGDSGEDSGSGKTDAGETDDDETGDGESPASESRDNGENSGTEDDDPDGQDGNHGGEGDDSDRDTGFGNQNGGRDLDDSEESDQDDKPGPQSSEGGESKAGEASEDEEPEDPVTPDPGEDGGDGFDVSSLLEEAEGELAAMAVAAERQEKEAARNATPEPNWSEVQEEVSKDLHKGCRFEWCDLPPSPPAYQELVQAQRGTIQRLVEEIRKALEFRVTVPRRNLKKGRLDAGSLWKLRVPDPRVFSRRETPGDVPAVAVYLLVDCSGSMSAYQYTSPKNRITAAKEAAAVLHEACVVLGVPHTVVGFDSARGQSWFYRAVDWDDRDGTKIASFRAGRNNRDGYAIRVVSKELELRPEPKKVLLVLSDGLPNDSPWGGDYDIALGSLPVADTARAVRELERRGIGVVGLFFGNEEHVPRARTIYKNFVYIQDIGHLPVILGRVLKQVITGGA